MRHYYAIIYGGFVVPETIRRLKRDTIKAAEAYFGTRWESMRDNPEWGDIRAARIEVRIVSPKYARANQ